MTQPILFDVVLLSGAITSLVAVALLWNGWRLYHFSEAREQRELTHALQRASRSR